MNFIKQFVFNKNIFILFWASLGVVYTANNVLNFYLNNINIIIQCLSFFQKNAWIIFILAYSYALIKNYNEIKAIKIKINNDFEVEIKIGDIYKEKGSLIIGSGSTFDTVCNISQNSLIGIFVKKYYKNKIENLDNIIEKSLEKYPYVNIEDGRKGKKKRYKLGAVAQVGFSNKRRAYLLAINDTNIDGNALNLNFEKMKEILNCLWKYIPNHRLDFDNQIVMPLLGTKFGGINNNKKEIIDLIFKTFVIHAKEKNICKKLTIVISLKDYLESKIKLRELSFLAEYACFEFEYKKNEYELLVL